MLIYASDYLLRYGIGIAKLLVLNGDGASCT